MGGEYGSSAVDAMAAEKMQVLARVAHGGDLDSVVAAEVLGAQMEHR